MRQFNCRSIVILLPFPWELHFHSIYVAHGTLPIGEPSPQSPRYGMACAHKSSPQGIRCALNCSQLWKFNCPHAIQCMASRYVTHSTQLHSNRLRTRLRQLERVYIAFQSYCHFYCHFLAIQLPLLVRFNATSSVCAYKTTRLCCLGTNVG